MMRLLLFFPLAGLAAGFLAGKGIIVTADLLLLMLGLSLVYWSFALPDALRQLGATLTLRRSPTHRSSPTVR
jgi:hypothetical protein